MSDYYQYIEHVEPLLSPEEAAALLHVGMNSMYKLLNSNAISAYRDGRIWKIPKRAVQQYILTKSKLPKSVW